MQIEKRVGQSEDSFEEHELMKKKMNKGIGKGRNSDPFRFISLERSVSNYRKKQYKYDKSPAGLFYADYSRPRTRPPSHN